MKIVIKVRVTSESCRKRALKNAVVPGASSVAMEGKDRDHVVVIGEGVDCLSLTMILKKKMGSAEIVSVRELNGGYGSVEEEVTMPQRSDYYTTRWHPSYQAPPQYVTYEGGYNPRPVYDPFRSYTFYHRDDD